MRARSTQPGWSAAKPRNPARRSDHPRGEWHGLQVVGGCVARAAEVGSVISIPAVCCLSAARPGGLPQWSAWPSGSSSRGARRGPILRHGHRVPFEARDRIKILVWDGSGLVLVWKQLSQTAFRWPPMVDGVMRLSAAGVRGTIRSRMLMPLLVRLTDSEVEAIDGVVPQVSDRIEDGRGVLEEVSSSRLSIDQKALLPDLHVDPIHGDI